MIFFYFKLLIFQTIYYALFWVMCYVDNSEILWKPMVITFYSISVLITFIIPVTKELKKNEKN
jgi:hypothetical protein